MRSKGVAILAFSLVGLLAVAGTAQAQSTDPTPEPRWLEVDYDVRITDDLGNLDLDGTVQIHETPSNDQTRRHCGSSCSADELRDLYQSSGQAGKQRLVEAIEGRIASRTETVLSSIADGGEASTSADVDESSLEAPIEDSGLQPAIPVDVTGQATIGALEGSGYTGAQVEALFDMGARAPVPVQADVDPGTNLTLALSVPDPLGVLDTGSDGERVGEQTVRWVVTNWKGGSEVSLDDEVTVGRPDVEVPSEERIDVDVVLDLSQIDIHYLGALTGGTAATIQAQMELNATVSAIENPEPLPGVRLRYLSADAIRIALANDLVPLEQITSFEDEARSAIRSAFRSTVGEAAPVSGGFVPSTLEVQAVGEPPGTGGPIRLEMSSEGEMPIPPETAGATAFEITRMQAGTLQLPAIPTPGDRPANVTILLPDGVELVYDDVQGGEVTRSETDDGRTALTFQTDGSGQGATIQNAEIVVNHPIVWDTLWPVLLFLLVVLVVVPGVLILLYLRRRRRRRGTEGTRGTSPISGGYRGQKAEGSTSDSRGESESSGGRSGPGTGE